MASKTAILFATANGSTRGIAERIGARLVSKGLEAHAAAVGEELSLQGYDAFVIGSAVHNSGWLPSALEFVEKQAETIAAKPTWLFSVSSLGDEESFFPRPVASFFRRGRSDPKIVALQQRLRARGHRNFAGVVRRGDWGWKGDMFLRAFGGHFGDSRNWPAIDAWADSIAAEFSASRL